METDHQSRPPRVKWPFDLRVFAVMSALWAACLAVSAFAHVGEMKVVDPVVTIFAGVRFSGDDARLVLIVEAGIFAMIALGVFTYRRGGLLLALCYMVQVVMSHLAFVVAYLPFPSEWMHVRAVASEGPIVVLVTLYLWIRACDLIFVSPPADAHPQASPEPIHRSSVRADSRALDVAAIAD